MRFLLDEDLPTTVAAVARGLGLDASSIQELKRLGLPDDVQLRYAAAEGYVFVTRNRDDFQSLTLEFFDRAEPHGGVLIVPRRLPNARPAAIAYALNSWAEEHADEPIEALAYRTSYLA